MSHVTRVAAVLAAIALTFTMPAAQAAKDSTADGTGDVWSSTWNETTESQPEPVPSTESVNVDLTKTVVTHGPKTIRVVAHYVNLKKTGDGYNFVVRTRDNKGRKTWSSVLVEPSRWRGVSILMTRDGYGCKGFRHTIDYAANTVTTQAPRRCMGKPRWIEYQARAQSWTVDDESSGTVFSDDARSDQAAPKGWSGRIRRG